MSEKIIPNQKFISNVRVYDLDESIIASGYPMRVDAQMREVEEKDIKRARDLVKLSKENHAHGQFGTGIRVNFDLKLSNKAWVEAERYRFLEFISSQSTMHKISKFDLKNQFNKYVDSRIIDIVIAKVERYNRLVANKPDPMLSEYEQELKDAYLEILYNNPAGFELTARMTTNYRCILNIINQRWNHRLPEWREVCREFLTLPMMEELIQLYAPSVDLDKLKAEEYID